MIILMATKATIVRVARNPKNAQGCILTYSNGQADFVGLTYVQKVLEGAFLDGMRPTALIGTEVSYDLHSYKAGDQAVDDKGKPVVNAAGQPILMTTEGKKVINRTFGEVEGRVTEFDKAQMNANALAKFAAAQTAQYGAKPARIAAPAQESEPVLQAADGEASEPTI